MFINEAYNVLLKNGLFFVEKTLGGNGHDFDRFVQGLIGELIPKFKATNDLLYVNDPFRDGTLFEQI